MYDPEASPSVPHSSARPAYGGEPFAVDGATSARTAKLGRAALAELVPDEDWSLTEEGFTLAREHEVESLLAIGNGYVGNRGSLAEGSPLSAPATFVAGIFELEQKPNAVPHFLALPDWTGIRAWIEGYPLSLDQGQVLLHRRVLDLRHGILWREWRHRDPHGRITYILSFRLASLADRHLLAQSVAFTPENYTGRIRLESSIELPANAIASPPPDQWKTRRNLSRPNVLPLALRSKARGVTVAFGAASQLVASGRNVGRREVEITDRRITERCHLEVEIGAEYRLDRLISIYSSRESADPVEAAIAHVNDALPHGVAGAVRAHEAAWRARWRRADVRVEPDEGLQRELRFALYHLISAANPDDDRVSIGARALTGEAYKGHVFWDTEIYMVPFYIFTHPPSARALLMYRYHTLPAAREKARGHNYRGAMYPWESADTGAETTPNYVVGLDGQVIHVLNGRLEVHISADVAYAVWQYWRATGDDEFLRSAGAEILLETARFWASRGELETDGQYHLRHVIGPDEYHDDVDDNAYTNLMAQWNLRQAVAVARLLERRWPERWRELAARLEIGSGELESWSRLADAMYTGFDPRTGIFEQFQGFYQKRHLDLKSYESRHAAMDMILGHEEIQTTDVVKQADVVMAIYLLWNQFPPAVREANFRYYEPLTGHGSSLSPSIHALLAARFGDLGRAELYLRQSAEIDLGNNMGNASGGVHAAAVGGLWQAMVFGFGGVDWREPPTGSNRAEVAEEKEAGEQAALNFDPHLLPCWRRLSFPLEVRGTRLDITLEPDSIAVQSGSESESEDEGQGLQIGLGQGDRATVGANQHWRARRQAGQWGPWQQEG